MKVYTAQEITEMADAWKYYPGFTATKCGACNLATMRELACLRGLQLRQ